MLTKFNTHNELTNFNLGFHLTLLQYIILAMISNVEDNLIIWLSQEIQLPIQQQQEQIQEKEQFQEQQQQQQSNLIIQAQTVQKQEELSLQKISSCPPQQELAPIQIINDEQIDSKSKRIERNNACQSAQPTQQSECDDKSQVKQEIKSQVKQEIIQELKFETPIQVIDSKNVNQTKQQFSPQKIHQEEQKCTNSPPKYRPFIQRAIIADQIQVKSDGNYPFYPQYRVYDVQQFANNRIRNPNNQLAIEYEERIISEAFKFADMKHNSKRKMSFDCQKDKQTGKHEVPFQNLYPMDLHMVAFPHPFYHQGGSGSVHSLQLSSQVMGLYSQDSSDTQSQDDFMRAGMFLPNMVKTQQINRYARINYVVDQGTHSRSSRSKSNSYATGQLKRINPLEDPNTNIWKNIKPQPCEEKPLQLEEKCNDDKTKKIQLQKKVNKPKQQTKKKNQPHQKHQQ